MNKSNQFSHEVRERAVRMVQEHRGEYPRCGPLHAHGLRARCLRAGYDHALAETINGLYQAEWVAWFNHHRLKEPLGCIHPVEAEANCRRQQASHATRYGLT